MPLRTDLKKVNEPFWSDGTITIRPMKTQNDLVYALFECQLSAEQQELVNPAGFSIGRAYLSPDDNVPCLICHETEGPIGFISLCRWLGKGDAYSWSFYIDTRHQGNGYGRSAAGLAVRILKAANPEKPIKLAAEADNEKAHRLYRSLGFRETGEMDGDDIVFCYQAEV